MKTRKLQNAWDALADTPEETINPAMRPGLMPSIEKVAEGWMRDIERGYIGR